MDRRLDDVDKTMKSLRKSMLGMQIRTAGFKKDHDRMAKSVGKVTALLADAGPLMKTAKKTSKTPK
ncbi:hypothetical protein CFN78_08530 [Amycolatopsis antarctica]|uniref:Uncharacterized protein n=1 Tax=Amycolatopsis antarctica TaxID=1854586 RepID=A0A263D8B1_9PSEU|nr:hypothetical protein CFN78_08530 [Amycolatopsis antarctica]